MEAIQPTLFSVVRKKKLSHLDQGPDRAAYYHCYSSILCWESMQEQSAERKELTGSRLEEKSTVTICKWYKSMHKKKKKNPRNNQAEMLGYKINIQKLVAFL